MTFAEALAALNAGKAVTRPAMGQGASVILVKEVNGSALTQPFFAFRPSSQPGLVTWTPQQPDMLASDWSEVAA